MTQYNKVFGLIKQCFCTRLTFLSTIAGVHSLICILMSNQECKVRPQIVNANSNEPVFYPLILKQVNAVVVAAISIVHVQNCVFLML